MSNNQSIFSKLKLKSINSLQVQSKHWPKEKELQKTGGLIILSECSLNP